MNLEVLVFGVMFVVALGCSLAMLFAPNAVHVALFLVGSQVALAVAFLLQGAFFVAIVQIIVYAGAIMVLFLFVIMLLGVDKREALIYTKDQLIVDQPIVRHWETRKEVDSEGRLDDGSTGSRAATDSANSGGMPAAVHPDDKAIILNPSGKRSPNSKRGRLGGSAGADRS